MSWEFDGFKIGHDLPIKYRGKDVPCRVVHALHEAGSNKEEVDRILEAWWENRKQKPEPNS